MKKIKFKLVDEEPVCCKKCPQHRFIKSPNPMGGCRVTGLYVVDDYSICAPGLQQQRDEFRFERNQYKEMYEAENIGWHSLHKMYEQSEARSTAIREVTRGNYTSTRDLVVKIRAILDTEELSK